MKGLRTVAVAVVLTLLPAALAVAGIEKLKLNPKVVAAVLLGPKRSLPCAKSPNSESVTITNTLSSPIPAGTRMAFDYVREEFNALAKPPALERKIVHVEGNLSSNLGPGQQQQWQAQNITYEESNCWAWFFAGLPDFELLQVSVSQGIALLRIRNNNSFVDAPQSIVRIKAMKCSQIELGKVDRPFPAIGAGGTQELSVPVSAPAGSQYYDAYVDPTNAFRESNETNNGYTGVGVCIY